MTMYFLSIKHATTITETNENAIITDYFANFLASSGWFIPIELPISAAAVLQNPIDTRYNIRHKFIRITYADSALTDIKEHKNVDS